MIEEKLKQYFKLEKEIHEFFGSDGYLEGVPLERWTGGWKVIEGLLLRTGDLPDRRIINRAIHRSEKHTMIYAENYCDTVSAYVILDNKNEKEVVDE